MKEFQLIDGESGTRFGHHGFNGSSPPSRPTKGESLGAFVFDLKARSRSVARSWNVGVKPFNKRMISRYEFQKWSKLGICWLVDDIHFERMYEKNEF